MDDAPDAFRQLLLGAIPRLRRYARSLVFDVNGADDLVQTALERALSHWQQFDRQRDILVWTISIAHNAYMDDRRRHARMTLVETHEDGLALDELHGAPGPDLGLRLDLIAALQRLPLEQREPLLLVTLEQFSYAECAETLRIPIGTVMSRISRGRAALRGWLDAAPAGAAVSVPSSVSAPASASMPAASAAVSPAAATMATTAVPTSVPTTAPTPGPQSTLRRVV